MPRVLDPFRDEQDWRVPVVTHLVSLQQAAGVEAHFSEFVRQSRVSHPSSRTVGSTLPARCIRSSPRGSSGELAHTIDAKRRFGLRLPAKP